eukprot:227467-Rhodomonas_salina.1
MTEVTKQLRAMRAGERWNPPPPEILVSRFFARYSSPDQNPLKRVLTPEKVVKMRDSLPKKNPAQAGFS